MSNLGFMEKLLDGIEVEWLSFGEIATIQRGASPRPIASYITDDENGVPWIKIGDTSTGSKYVNGTAQKITNEGAKKSRILKKGDFILSNSMSFGRPYILNICGAIHDGWASISDFGDKLDSDYLYHFLSSHNVQNYWLSKINSGSVSNLNADLIKTLQIPIPCPEVPDKSLAIQRKIVEVLDTFTELTTELTTELSARKKQYNYYRDQLLSFEEGEVEWKTLGDLAENLDSKRKPITSGLREPGDTPYYGASGIVDYVKDYIFDEDLLLVSEDGANLLARNTPIAFSISGKTWVNNHAHVLKFETYAERRYVEFYLNSIDLTPYISGAAQPKLNKRNLNGIRIPNPSPEEKVKIVATLDKFHALTSSRKEGLPREIELRQKQYEYYRDLLLSFPKPEIEEGVSHG
ncbi:restriction endonuclease subunit S [Shewanella atlantica]|uniref:restriction endonuclease subunit S n=1 Tax=Shewanella atlantica TaxID=271099 RepID=UPI003736898C